jgi:two-component system sensor histidine kinase BaeS
MVFRSLAFKWTMTLLLTSLIGVILVGVFAFRTTMTEFDRLRSDQAQSFFIQNATNYYEANGSWDGLVDWLEDRQGPSMRVQGMPRPESFALVDASGEIVAGRGMFVSGTMVSSAQIAEGTSILLDGETIGTVLLADTPPALDPREQGYVDGTNRALLIGALGAGATSLVIGLLLSRQFLRPLSQLTEAITAMHAGDLDQRVELNTRDELGLLAQTFNEMSANLSRANQLRQQMTADIAHDLRTPLTVIAGYLEGLRDGTFQPTPERFRVMSEEVNLLQRLVEDLRTLSLADAGELKLMRAAVKTSELLERVEASFKEQAASSGVTLHVETDSNLPEVMIDSERMAQVLGNLVANALRHTPNGGSITLSARQTASDVELNVRDTGSGIAPADLPKIFDRFYRGDPSRQSEGGESGLGLAIARSIVEAHGGTISATSTLGTGTMMMIRLPLKTT